MTTFFEETPVEKFTIKLTTQEIYALACWLVSDEADRDVCQPKFQDRVRRAAELLGVMGL
jgi:hypothetical protein